jgi:type IV pilus assembly protein PilX
MTSSPLNSCRATSGRQRGLSLIFALLALAAMMLAAVAVVRSVDTSGQVLGNLGFKQDTMLASDDAARQAIDWLNGRRTDVALYDAIDAEGYYPNSVPTLDATGRRATDATRTVIDWDGNGCARYTVRAACIAPSAQKNLANGVTAHYLITRLCTARGNPTIDDINCARPLQVTENDGTDHSGLNHGKPGPISGEAGSGVYFRIIVRAAGARNTVSFTETIVQL